MGQLESSAPMPKHRRQVEMLLEMPNLQGLLNMDYVEETLLDLQSSHKTEQVVPT